MCNSILHQCGYYVRIIVDERPADIITISKIELMNLSGLIAQE
jgi:hypothetical protein